LKEELRKPVINMLSMKVGRDVFDYINTVRNSSVKQRMKKRVQEYMVNPSITEQFEKLEEKLFLVIIAAEWSSEAQTCVSDLAKLLKTANNANLVAKVVDYDNNQDIVEELSVKRVPTVIVYDRQQRELGRYVEGVSRSPSVEEEIINIIEKSDRSIPAATQGA